MASLDGELQLCRIVEIDRSEEEIETSSLFQILTTYAETVATRSLSNTIDRQGIVEFSASLIPSGEVCRMLSIDSLPHRHVRIPKHPSVPSCPPLSDERRDSPCVADDRTDATPRVTVTDFAHLREPLQMNSILASRRTFPIRKIVNISVIEICASDVTENISSILFIG